MDVGEETLPVLVQPEEEAGVEGVGSPGDIIGPAFAPSPVGDCSPRCACSSAELFGTAGSRVGVAPWGEYAVALGTMSAASYGGGVCTLDMLELELGRPIPTAEVLGAAAWGRNGEWSRVGLGSTAACPGRARADESTVGDGSGMGLVKGWLSGSLSIIASIVSASSRTRPVCLRFSGVSEARRWSHLGRALSRQDCFVLVLRQLQTHLFISRGQVVWVECRDAQ